MHLIRISAAVMAATILGAAVAGCGQSKRTGSTTQTASPSIPSTGFIASDTAFIGSQSAYLTTEHRVESAWLYSLGQDVVIANIDAGVVDVPELSGQMIGGYDFINEDESAFITAAELEADLAAGYFPFDHGTPVSSIMAARADGLGIIGVANRAKIMPLRVFTTDGYTTYPVLGDAMYYAANSQARIINCEFVTYERNSSLLEATRYAVERGKIVIAAAGNDSYEMSAGSEAFSYPACYPGVICVGATRRVHSPDGEYLITRADFSNFGDEVDIYARGYEVAAAYGFVADFDWFSFSLNVSFGQQYADFAGTSASTPIVTGVVALALGIDPTLDAQTIKALLQETADDFPPHGKKLMNADRFIQAVVAQRGMPRGTSIYTYEQQPTFGSAVTTTSTGRNVDTRVLLSAQGRAERQQSLHDATQRVRSATWQQPRRR